MSDQMEMFNELSRNVSITTEELDSAVSAMSKQKDEYTKAKALSDAAYMVYQETRGRLISMLQGCGKTKYSVDGIGTATVTEKLKVKTPKGLEDKMALANWLKERVGEEGMHTYLGINYNTLNSLYNTEFEQAKDNGTAADFSIPGIEAPEAEFGLQFRR